MILKVSTATGTVCDVARLPQRQLGFLFLFWLFFIVGLFQ